MSDPVEPPTLFKLAVNALVAGCKLGNYMPTLDPQKIPPAVGKLILNHISLMEIIIIASNQSLYDWMSSLLPNNFVIINVWIVTGSRRIIIDFKCDGRPNLYWDFVYQDLNDSNFDQSQFFMLKIADKVFPTEFSGIQSFDSYVSNPETVQFEMQVKIIEWICQLFRRELNEFESYDGSAEEYLKSSAIINAQSFEMTDCCYQYAFLEKLLTVRHQRGLKTQTTCVQIKEPLQFSPELFRDLEISRDADLNFSFYSLEEVVQVITPWVPRLLRIRAKIPNWSPRDLRVFKRRLNLRKENDNIELKHHMDFREGWNYEKLYKIENENAMVFRFAGTQPGKFTQMIYVRLMPREF
ncbi:hypothetical protein CAEBREN_03323 [Caenorhabditis brenneri]|uniref:F-box domain-containing protein n=1 Tax=Caenorhabditis brenneri TaxID=135651 RepID=G0MA96_CAEBE|nr:hypothetical protein CAEBREN_03323 [Caenorhabditis brenneri]